MKTCGACGEPKPLSDFYDHPETRDGKAGICKFCHKARMIHRSRTNPRVQEYDRERAKRPEKKEAIRRCVKPWREKNPQRWKACVAINNAIRDGRLTKPPVCERCGQPDSRGKVRGIPKDLAKPLESVEWLCAKCQLRRVPDVLAS